MAINSKRIQVYRLGKNGPDRERCRDHQDYETI